MARKHQRLGDSTESPRSSSQGSLRSPILFTGKNTGDLRMRSYLYFILLIFHCKTTKILSLFLGLKKKIPQGYNFLRGLHFEASTFLFTNIFKLSYFTSWLLGYYKANTFFRKVFRELKYTNGNTLSASGQFEDNQREPPSPHTSLVVIFKDRKRESGLCSYLHGCLIFSTHERLRLQALFSSDFPLQSPCSSTFSFLTLSSVKNFLVVR